MPTLHVSEDVDLDAIWIDIVCDVADSYINGISKGAWANPTAASSLVLSMYPCWPLSYLVNT